MSLDIEDVFKKVVRDRRAVTETALDGGTFSSVLQRHFGIVLDEEID